MVEKPPRVTICYGDARRVPTPTSPATDSGRDDLGPGLDEPTLVRCGRRRGRLRAAGASDARVLRRGAGSGVEFGDIFELLDGSVDSGIMVGEQIFDFRAPLEIDREYAVEGGITDVVRKAGRRAGVFDIATFELRVYDAGAREPVAVSTTSFVFPRHGEQP